MKKAKKEMLPYKFNQFNFYYDTHPISADAFKEALKNDLLYTNTKEVSMINVREYGCNFVPLFYIYSLHTLNFDEFFEKVNKRPVTYPGDRLFRAGAIAWGLGFLCFGGLCAAMYKNHTHFVELFVDALNPDMAQECLKKMLPMYELMENEKLVKAPFVFNPIKGKKPRAILVQGMTSISSHQYLICDDYVIENWKLV